MAGAAGRAAAGRAAGGAAARSGAAKTAASKASTTAAKPLPATPPASPASPAPAPAASAPTPAPAPAPAPEPAPAKTPPAGGGTAGAFARKLSTSSEGTPGYYRRAQRAASPTVAMNAGGGALLGLMAYAVGLTYLRGGREGVKALIRAKFLNKTTPAGGTQ